MEEGDVQILFPAENKFMDFHLYQNKYTEVATAQKDNWMLLKPRSLSDPNHARMKAPKPNSGKKRRIIRHAPPAGPMARAPKRAKKVAR